MIQWSRLARCKIFVSGGGELGAVAKISYLVYVVNLLLPNDANTYLLPVLRGDWWIRRVKCIYKDGYDTKELEYQQI